MSRGVLPWVYAVWDALGFLDVGGCFLPHIREVFDYYLLKYFLTHFLFVFFFWDTYDLNVGAFNFFPEVSEVVLISFNSFFLCASFISTILSSTSPILPLLFSSLYNSVNLSGCFWLWRIVSSINLGGFIVYAV